MNVEIIGEFLCGCYVRNGKAVMTDDTDGDDEALIEYGTALQRFLTYFDAPERAKDPDWWDRVLQKDDETWWELHRRNLLETPKYFEVVLNAHRLANRVRAARERRQ